MITLLMLDMFDTIGTLIGAADRAGYLDENGNQPKVERAMLADAIATASGAVLGMPVFCSITDGIAFGFIAYFIVKLEKGMFKEIHPIMYVVVLLFIVKYVITALGY